MKPVKTRVFKKFLESLHLEEKRTKGSHVAWNRKDGSLPRPIIFRPAEKEVPPTHIKTIPNTLGMTEEEFLDRIKKL